MGRDTDDPAVQALVELKGGLERTIADLGAAAARADELIERRTAGASWLDIVSTEEPPLVIETITRVLDELGELGSRFRREEALALQRENISITKIGELFRVSRQRVSTILQGTRSRAEA
jgi:transposase